MTMQGADVRKAREALGWNRPKLAEQLNQAISPGRISRIESGSGIDQAEEAALREVLAAALEDAPITGAPPGVGAPAPDEIQPMPGVDAFDTGVQVLEEWAGLVKGDVVKLKDDAKEFRKYTFRRIVKKPGQEYVEIMPTGRGMLRTVRPDMLLVQRKGKWTEVNT